MFLDAMYIHIHDYRSKGPCQRRDCPLQRPPGLQHETPPKFFSEFAKIVEFFGENLAKGSNMRPLAKNKRGVLERFAKVPVYARRMVVCS